MFSGDGTLEPEKVQLFLEQVEQQVENILSDKAEIIALDKRRNCNREALRQLQSDGIHSKSYHSWTCVGNMFMKLPRTDLIKNISKEQKQLDEEINKIRNGLRSKVNELNELEGKEKTKGSGLTAMSKDEWTAIKQVIQYS